jgi:hypothetical protein
MEANEKRLILITEGAAHTVEYFHKHKVYPNSVVFEATKYREMSPYLTKDDEVLVVIKGLTDFTMSEIYALLNDLEESEEKLRSVTVLSNVDLGKISSSYYLYSGDLFYGTVKEVINGKVYDIVPASDEESKDTKKGKKSKKDKQATQTEKPVEVMSVNSVLLPYKQYNKKDVQFKVYGSNKKIALPSHALDNLTSKLVNIDLFKVK